MKSKWIVTMLVMVMSMISMNSCAQVPEFSKYSDVKDVTYVYVSQFMLKLAGKAAAPSVNGVDLKSIMSKLKGLQVVTAENKVQASKLKNDTYAYVEKYHGELLMQVDEDGEKVRIYFHEGKRNSVIILLQEDKEETVVVVFSGSFTLDDVMKMVKQ